MNEQDAFLATRALPSHALTAGGQPLPPREHNPCGPDDFAAQCLVEAIDQQVQSTQQSKELLTVAVLLASIRVPPDLLTAFLESRSMFDLLQDTPSGQQLLQDAERRGEQRGELRGEQRGRGVGRTARLHRRATAGSAPTDGP